MKHLMKWICATFVVSVGLIIPSATADTVTVTNKNDAGAGSLRQAVANVSDGGTVNFQAGLTGTITLTNGELLIEKSLTITGPGKTILTVSGNFSSRIFNVQSGIVAISGLKLNEGIANDNSPYESSGGAVLVSENARVTLTNCSVQACSTTGWGGAARNHGTLTTTNCDFSNNNSGESGGAIANQFATSTVSNCSFSANTAVNHGGGIDNEQGTITVKDTTFSSNQAAFGGGIYGALNSTVINCVFSANNVTEEGGGIYASETLTVNNSKFTNNTANGFYGGGGVSNSGTANISNSTFTGNTATGERAGGGLVNYRTITINNSTFTSNSDCGIANHDGTCTIRNCTVTNNLGVIGGGIFEGSGTVNLSNSTITGNRATNEGGGLFDGYGSFNVRNSIIANNTVDEEGIGPDCVGTITSQDYNLIKNTSGATISGIKTHNIVGQDPKLGALANNGGPTQTMALAPDSPAVDAGNSGGITTDQRGETRPYDQSSVPDAEGGDGSDIGAYELQELPPSISINDPAAVVEGLAGTTKSLIFTVTLSKTSTSPVTVKYATQDGTAIAPDDYVASAGTLSFAAGQTSKTVTIIINGDNLNEASETFRVNLSVPTNATIADAQGIGTITDDDRAPSLSINNKTITEGNSGTVNATFTITLSAVSGQSVSVSAVPYNGTATSLVDYTSGGVRLTFAPGETSKIFSVPVKGDLLDEPSETFYVILSAPTNASLGTSRGVGTITDDDTPPTISVDNVSIGEGNSGQRTAVFRLKLSAPSGQVVRVNYATIAGTATAGNDYVEVAPTQVAFTTGNLYAYARVLINGDALTEANETFFVNLSSPLNATITDNQALGTILNDDSAPSLTINDVSITEGNSVTKNLTFTVALSKASGQTITVNYNTTDGTATAGSDYVAKSGALNFAAGQTSKTVSIVINGDVIVEGDEALYVFLSGAVNASVGRARGIGTINNDDSSG